MRKLYAEALGTAILVFTGTGAIVVNDVSKGTITHVGIALVFGLVVMALVYTLGHISGAHLNPAVTIGLAAAGRFPARQIPGYLVAQLIGAFAASFSLRLMFPGHATLGATLPAGSALQSAVLEGILTAILMFVILLVTTAPAAERAFAGIAIGGIIGLEAMFGGPICGASMNPARSLAPAIVSGRSETVWIYIVAPIVGALAGVLAARLLNEPTTVASQETKT
jgi:aquaporin NIP